MSLTEELTAAQAALDAAQKQVLACTRQLNELKAQARTKYCPFKQGDAVPIAATRFLRVSDPPTIYQDEQGRWHWSIETVGCFDVVKGTIVPMSYGLYNRKHYGIHDDAFYALPTEVRNATPESMVEATRAAHEAKVAQPLTLNVVDRQLLAALPADFAEGKAVRCPFEVATLTRDQVQQGWRRLLRKGVIEVSFSGGRSDHLPFQEQRSLEALRPYHAPQILAGPKMAEAKALLDQLKVEREHGPARRTSRRPR
jgi:hypothetical protein